MRNNVAESVIAVVLVVLLVFLVNPLNLFMPSMMQMLVVALAGLLFILFAGFVWREQAQDEREELHRFLAARFAYLVGTGILMFAVLVQSFAHMLDPWIILALVGMLIAKVAGRMYAKHRH
ncbi:MAG: hypothetical protein AAB547_02940 [Patescibacteria group bacterium]